jgi:co-chaperonin GroES (HSP10)
MRKSKVSNVKNNSGLKPLGRAVLVKPYLVEEKTGGGLILPGDVVRRDQLAEQRAMVIEIGPEAWKGERDARAVPGDKILFSKWAGYQAAGPFDGEIYRVVNDADIFMAITKEK